MVSDIHAASSKTDLANEGYVQQLIFCAT